MDSVFGRLVKESKSEGRREGEATNFLQMLENLQKNMEFSLESALAALGKTLEDYENAKAILKK